MKEDKPINLCIINNDTLGYHKYCSSKRYDIGYMPRNTLLRKIFKFKINLQYLEVDTELKNSASLNNLEGAHYVTFEKDYKLNIIKKYLASNSFSHAVDIVRYLDEYMLEYKGHKIDLVKFKNTFYFYTSEIDSNIFNSMENIKKAIDLKIEYSS